MFCRFFCNSQINSSQSLCIRFRSLARRPSAVYLAFPELIFQHSLTTLNGPDARAYFLAVITDAAFRFVLDDTHVFLDDTYAVLHVLCACTRDMS
jgi:hypothetical protein